MEEEDKIVDIDNPQAVDAEGLEGSKGPSYFKEMYDSLDFSENPYINNEQDFANMLMHNTDFAEGVRKQLGKHDDYESFASEIAQAANPQDHIYVDPEVYKHNPDQLENLQELYATSEANATDGKFDIARGLDNLFDESFIDKAIENLPGERQVIQNPNDPNEMVFIRPDGKYTRVKDVGDESTIENIWDFSSNQAVKIGSAILAETASIGNAARALLDQYVLGNEDRNAWKEYLSNDYREGIKDLRDGNTFRSDYIKEMSDEEYNELGSFSKLGSQISDLLSTKAIVGGKTEDIITSMGEIAVPAGVGTKLIQSGKLGKYAQVYRNTLGKAGKKIDDVVGRGSQTGQKVFEAIGDATTYGAIATALEANMEARHQYEQGVAKYTELGLSQEEAESLALKEAKDILHGNLGGLFVSNMIEGLVVTTPLGLLGGSGRKAAEFMGRVALQSGSEAAEEGYQYTLGKYVEDKYNLDGSVKNPNEGFLSGMHRALIENSDSREFHESLVAGAMLGGVMTTATNTSELAEDVHYKYKYRDLRKSLHSELASGDNLFKTVTDPSGKVKTVFNIDAKIANDNFKTELADNIALVDQLSESNFAENKDDIQHLLTERMGMFVRNALNKNPNASPSDLAKVMERELTYTEAGFRKMGFDQRVSFEEWNEFRKIALENAINVGLSKDIKVDYVEDRVSDPDIKADINKKLNNDRYNLLLGSLSSKQLRDKFIDSALDPNSEQDTFTEDGITYAITDKAKFNKYNNLNKFYNKAIQQHLFQDAKKLDEFVNAERVAREARIAEESNREDTRREKAVKAMQEGVQKFVGQVKKGASKVEKLFGKYLSKENKEVVEEQEEPPVAPQDQETPPNPTETGENPNDTGDTTQDQEPNPAEDTIPTPPPPSDVDPSDFGLPNFGNMSDEELKQAAEDAITNGADPSPYTEELNKRDQQREQDSKNAEQGIRSQIDDLTHNYTGDINGVDALFGGVSKEIREHTKFGDAIKQSLYNYLRNAITALKKRLKPKTFVTDEQYRDQRINTRGFIAKDGTKIEVNLLDLGADSALAAPAFETQRIDRDGNSEYNPNGKVINEHTRLQSAKKGGIQVGDTFTVVTTMVEPQAMYTVPIELVQEGIGRSTSDYTRREISYDQFIKTYFGDSETLTVLIGKDQKPIEFTKQDFLDIKLENSVLNSHVSVHSPLWFLNNRIPDNQKFNAISKNLEFRRSLALGDQLTVQSRSPGTLSFTDAVPLTEMVPSNELVLGLIAGEEKGFTSGKDEQVKELEHFPIYSGKLFAISELDGENYKIPLIADTIKGPFLETVSSILRGLALPEGTSDVGLDKLQDYLNTTYNAGISNITTPQGASTALLYYINANKNGDNIDLQKKIAVHSGTGLAIKRNPNNPEQIYLFINSRVAPVVITQDQKGRDTLERVIQEEIPKLRVVANKDLIKDQENLLPFIQGENLSGVSYYQYLKDTHSSYIRIVNTHKVDGKDNFSSGVNSIISLGRSQVNPVTQEVAEEKAQDISDIPTEISPEDIKTDSGDSSAIDTKPTRNQPRRDRRRDKLKRRIDRENKDYNEDLLLESIDNPYIIKDADSAITTREFKRVLGRIARTVSLKKLTHPDLSDGEIINKELARYKREALKRFEEIKKQAQYYYSNDPNITEDQRYDFMESETGMLYDFFGPNFGLHLDKDYQGELTVKQEKELEDDHWGKIKLNVERLISTITQQDAVGLIEQVQEQLRNQMNDERSFVINPDDKISVEMKFLLSGLRVPGTQDFFELDLVASQLYSLLAIDNDNYYEKSWENMLGILASEENKFAWKKPLIDTLKELQDKAPEISQQFTNNFYLVRANYENAKFTGPRIITIQGEPVKIGPQIRIHPVDYSNVTRLIREQSLATMLSNPNININPDSGAININDVALIDELDTILTKGVQKTPEQVARFFNILGYPTTPELLLNTPTRKQESLVAYFNLYTNSVKRGNLRKTYFDNSGAFVANKENVYSDRMFYVLEEALADRNDYIHNLMVRDGSKSISTLTTPNRFYTKFLEFKHAKQEDLDISQYQESSVFANSAEERAKLSYGTLGLQALFSSSSQNDKPKFSQLSEGDQLHTLVMHFFGDNKEMKAGSGKFKASYVGSANSDKTRIFTIKYQREIFTEPLKGGTQLGMGSDTKSRGLFQKLFNALVQPDINRMLDQVNDGSTLKNYFPKLFYTIPDINYHPDIAPILKKFIRNEITAEAFKQEINKPKAVKAIHDSLIDHVSREIAIQARNFVKYNIGTPDGTNIYSSIDDKVAQYYTKNTTVKAGVPMQMQFAKDFTINSMLMQAELKMNIEGDPAQLAKGTRGVADGELTLEAVKNAIDTTNTNISKRLAKMTSPSDPMNIGTYNMLVVSDNSSRSHGVKYIASILDNYLNSYRGLNIIDSSNITTQEGTKGAAKYNRKNNQIILDRTLLKQKFEEKAWTNPRDLIEIIHGEKITSKAESLPENQFNTYEEFESFVIEHEYQHSLYSKQDFDKEFPNKTKGDYETAINNRALEAIANNGNLSELDELIQQYDNALEAGNKTEAEKILDTHFLNSKNYFNINHADAQEFVHWDHHLKLLESEGVVPKSTADQIRKKIKKDGGKSLTKSELENVFNAYKPLYVGEKFVDTVRVDYFVKSSHIPLLPYQVKGTPLEGLLEFMSQSDKNNDSGIKASRVTFESAVKQGLPTDIPTLFDGVTQEFVGVQALNEHVKSFPHANITLESKYLGKQLETGNETKDKVTDSIQYRKLLPANIQNEPVGANGETVKELNQKRMELYNEKARKEYLRVVQEITSPITDSEGKIMEDTDGNVLIGLDIEKLYGFIKEEMITRGYDINEQSFLRIVGEDNSRIFSLPLYANNNPGKFQSLIASLINKGGVSSIKRTGTGAPQVSSIGTLAGDVRSGIKWVSSKKGALNHLDSRGVAEIILPWKFSEPIENFLKDGYIDPEKLPDELLRGIGYRIPGQGHSSMLPFKIVGFLPESHTNHIVVPSEITQQMGSDFDIDKFYSYLPSSTIKYKYDFTKIDAKRNELEDLYDAAKEFPEVREYHKEVLRDVEAKFEDGTYTDDDNRMYIAALDVLEYYNQIEQDKLKIKDQIFELYDDIDRIPDRIVAKKGAKSKLDDQIFDIEYQILAAENKYIKQALLQPLDNSMDDLRKAIEKNQARIQQENIIRLNGEISRATDAFTKKTKQAELDQLTKPASFASPSYQLGKFQAGSAGKVGVGQFSLLLTFQGAIQDFRVGYTSPLYEGKNGKIKESSPFINMSWGNQTMSPNFFVKWDRKSEKKLENFYKKHVPNEVRENNEYGEDWSTFESFRDNFSKTNLDKYISANKIKFDLSSLRTKSYNIIGYQTASVDNANEGMLDIGNLTSETFRFAKVALLAGLDFDAIQGIVQQPIIKRYHDILDGLRGVGAKFDPDVERTALTQVSREFNYEGYFDNKKRGKRKNFNPNNMGDNVMQLQLLDTYKDILNQHAFLSEAINLTNTDSGGGGKDFFDIHIRLKAYNKYLNSPDVSYNLAEFLQNSTTGTNLEILSDLYGYFNNENLNPLREQSEAIANIVDEYVRIMNGGETLSSFKEKEMYDRAFKTVINVKKNIALENYFEESVESIRAELISDVSNTTNKPPLAKIVTDLQTGNFDNFNILDRDGYLEINLDEVTDKISTHPLIKNLTMVEESFPKGKLYFLKSGNKLGGKFDRNTIHTDIIQLYNSDIPISNYVKDGIPYTYTSQHLVTDMFKYAMVTDTEVTSSGFGNLLPADLYHEIFGAKEGISPLNNYKYRPDDEVSLMFETMMVNNPDLIPDAIEFTPYNQGTIITVDADSQYVKVRDKAGYDIIYRYNASLPINSDKNTYERLGVFRYKNLLRTTAGYLNGGTLTSPIMGSFEAAKKRDLVQPGTFVNEQEENRYKTLANFLQYVESNTSDQTDLKIIEAFKLSDIQDYRIEFKEFSNKGIVGSYTAGDKFIKMSSTHPKAKSKRAIYHEMTHALVINKLVEFDAETGELGLGRKYEGYGGLTEDEKKIIRELNAAYKIYKKAYSPNNDFGLNYESTNIGEWISEIIANPEIRAKINQLSKNEPSLRAYANNLYNILKNLVKSIFRNLGFTQPTDVADTYLNSILYLGTKRQSPTPDGGAIEVNLVDNVNVTSATKVNSDGTRSALPNYTSEDYLADELSFTTLEESIIEPFTGPTEDYLKDQNISLGENAGPLSSEHLESLEPTHLKLSRIYNNRLAKLLEDQSNLNNQLKNPNTTDKERVRANKQLREIAEELPRIREALELSVNIDHITEVALLMDKDFDYLDRMLAIPEFAPSDFQLTYVNELIENYKKFFDASNEELGFMSSKVRDKLNSENTVQYEQAVNDLKSKISAYRIKLEEELIPSNTFKHRRFIKDLAQEDIGISKMNMNEVLKDLTWVGSWVLSVDRTNEDLLGTYGYIVQKTEIDKNRELQTRYNRIDDLHEKALSWLIKNKNDKFGIFGGFIDDDGNLIQRYSQSFFDRQNAVNEALEVAKENWNIASIPNIKAALKKKYDKARADQRRFYEENTEVIDVGALVSNNKKYKAALKKRLGDNQYKAKTKEALNNLELFKRNFEAYKKSIKNLPSTPSEKVAMIKEYEILNSPIIYSRFHNRDVNDFKDSELDVSYKDSSGNTISNKVYPPFSKEHEYIVKIIRQYNNQGQDLGNYNADFTKISSNQNALNYYNEIRSSFDDVKAMIPSYMSQGLKASDIPYYEKLIFEGILNGITKSPTNELKRLYGRLGETLTERVPEESRSLANNRVLTNLNKKSATNIAKIVQPRYEKYWLDKGISLDKINNQPLLERRRIRREIENQVKADLHDFRSFDLKRIAKMYLYAGVEYQSKSKSINSLALNYELAMSKFKNEDTGALKFNAGVQQTDSNTVAKNKIDILESSHQAQRNLPVREPKGRIPYKQYNPAERFMRDEIKKTISALEKDLKSKKAKDDLEYKKTIEARLAEYRNELDELGGYMYLGNFFNILKEFTTLSILGLSLNSFLPNAMFGFIANNIQASDQRVFSRKTMETIQKEIYGKSRLTTFGLTTMGAVFGNVILPGWGLLAGAAIGRAIDSQLVKKSPVSAKILSFMKERNALAKVEDEMRKQTPVNGVSWLNKFGIKGDGINPYIFTENSEIPHQATIFGSILLETKIGEKSLLDYITEDGKVKEPNKIVKHPKFDKDVSIAELVDEALISGTALISRVHGNYRTGFKQRIKYDDIGSPLATLRTWMFESFYSRYESEKEDLLIQTKDGAGYKVKGYYRSARDTMGYMPLIIAGLSKGGATNLLALLATGSVGASLVPSIIKLGGAGIGIYALGKRPDTNTDQKAVSKAFVKNLAYSMNRFMMLNKIIGDVYAGSKNELKTLVSDVDYHNLQKLITELSFNAFFTLLYFTALAAKGLTDDDEKEKDAVDRLLVYTLNFGGRMMLDLDQYSSPTDLYSKHKDITRIVPMLRTIDIMGKLGNALMTMDQYERSYRGYKKGDYKAERYFKQLFPYINQVDKTLNQFTQEYQIFKQE